MQIAETQKVHAEEKEEEVRLLERSIEELECTINVLEQKVSLLIKLYTKTYFAMIYNINMIPLLRLILSKEKLRGSDCRERSLS